MGFSFQLFIWREGSFWQEKLLLKLQGCSREGSGEVLLWSCWLPSSVLSSDSVYALWHGDPALPADS